jgi:hypothetical protein
MPEVRVTMDDLRVAGHCAPGIVKFFESHSLDLRRLVREGLPLSEFEGIDDVNLERVKTIAADRTLNNG